MTKPRTVKKKTKTKTKLHLPRPDRKWKKSHFCSLHTWLPSDRIVLKTYNQTKLSFWCLFIIFFGRQALFSPYLDCHITENAQSILNLLNTYNEVYIGNQGTLILSKFMLTTQLNKESHPQTRLLPMYSCELFQV